MVPAGGVNFLGWGGTVTPVSGATFPKLGVATGPVAPAANVAGSPSNAQPQAMTGKTGGGTFMGEPFAVWLGLVLFLFVLKILAELPEGPRILGENVNPAFMRIGAYNIAAIGVIASVWIVLMKVIFNRFTKIPAMTAFANAV